MRIYRHLNLLPSDARGAVVAIGNFDGVHKGHQQIIASAGEKARQVGAPLAILTFEPHPRRFFALAAPRFELMPFRSKARHLERLGLDFLYVPRFDANLCNLSAEAFVETVLTGNLGIRAAVVGYDFRFGSKRTGDIALLRWMGRKFGFDVIVLPPALTPEGELYSSTNIRRLLQEGKPREARRLLGRSWGIHGSGRTPIVPGEELASAAVSMREYLHPRPGFYVVWIGIESQDAVEWFHGLAWVTAEDAEPTATIYALDCLRSIEAEHLWVAFEDYIGESNQVTDRWAETIKRQAIAARAYFSDASLDRSLPPNVSLPRARQMAEAEYLAGLTQAIDAHGRTAFK